MSTEDLGIENEDLPLSSPPATPSQERYLLNASVDTEAQSPLGSDQMSLSEAKQSHWEGFAKIEMKVEVAPT